MHSNPGKMKYFSRAPRGGLCCKICAYCGAHAQQTRTWAAITISKSNESLTLNFKLIWFNCSTFSNFITIPMWHRSQLPTTLSWLTYRNSLSSTTAQAFVQTCSSNYMWHRFILETCLPLMTGVKIAIPSKLGSLTVLSSIRPPKLDSTNTKAITTQQYNLCTHMLYIQRDAWFLSFGPYLSHLQSSHHQTNVIRPT